MATTSCCQQQKTKKRKIIYDEVKSQENHREAAA
jgi:hypothetical protein